MGTLTTPPLTVSVCPPHRWRVATPDGNPTADGICLHCGCSKPFPVAWLDIAPRNQRRFGTYERRIAPRLKRSTD